MGKELSLLIHSLPFLLKGALVTLELTFMSMGIGFVGGVFIGVFNCEKLRNPLSTYLFNSFVWVIRGTPLFIQVLIVYYALPEVIGISLSPFIAGMIALGVNSMAYVAEIVRGGVNAISLGQWEAAYTVGLTTWQSLKGIILPQMFRIAFPNFTNELSSLIKETSILMIIGVAELTKVSRDIASRELDPMTLYLEAAFLYLMMTTLLSGVVHYMQKKKDL